MSEPTIVAAVDTSRAPWWISAIQTLGVVTVAFFLLFRWADITVKWEREQMIPAIQKSCQSLDHNTEVMQRIERVLVRMDEQATGNHTPPAERAPPL